VWRPEYKEEENKEGGEKEDERKEKRKSYLRLVLFFFHQLFGRIYLFVSGLTSWLRPR
jgi:hypothetical protein